MSDPQLHPGVADAEGHHSMRLASADGGPIAVEYELMLQRLPLADARVLELGCGAAEKTRQLAGAGVREIIAAEVDAAAHAKNLAGAIPARVRFESFGAEDIPLADASIDLVVMFKSLHHVPGPALDQAMAEIARVLVPGGSAWISEPVYAGDFNDIMRLFHDEQQVRQAAFEALRRAVESGLLALEEEIFFRNRLRFDSFEQYERGVLGVTHSDYRLTPEVLTEVRERFMGHASAEGFVFEIPNRVDLLRKI